MYVHFILSWKYHILVPEDDQVRPKHVAFVDGTNKVCDGWRQCLGYVFNVSYLSGMNLNNKNGL